MTKLHGVGLYCKERKVVLQNDKYELLFKDMSKVCRKNNTAVSSKKDIIEKRQ